MMARHIPLLFGLFTAITLVSLATIIYRVIGFNRGDALYLACLTFVGVAYFVSRRVLQQCGRK